jgi:multifunctional methyltransferase subunit TRM112
LKIVVAKATVTKKEFNAEFIKNFLAKVDWPALVGAAAAFKIALPPKLDPAFATSEAFLKQVHHALLEVVLVDGFLVCPESGRKFPVKDCIPNMLLNEDEI